MDTEVRKRETEAGVRDGDGESCSSRHLHKSCRINDVNVKSVLRRLVGGPLASPAAASPTSVNKEKEKEREEG